MKGLSEVKGISNSIPLKSPEKQSFFQGEREVN